MKKKLIILAIVLFLFIILGIWIRAKIRHEANLIIANRDLTAQLAQSEANRKQIEAQKKTLQVGFDSLQVISDNSDKKITDLQKTIAILTKQYKDTIAKLSTIPADTVYKMVFTHFPDMGEPLTYRFAEPQVRGIYSMMLDENYLTTRLDLTEQAFNECSTQVQTKTAQITNLTGQISLMRSDTDELTSQRDALKNSLKTAQKQVKKKQAWNWIYKVGIIAGATALILK